MIRRQLTISFENIELTIQENPEKIQLRHLQASSYTTIYESEGDGSIMKFYDEFLSVATSEVEAMFDADS